MQNSASRNAETLAQVARADQALWHEDRPISVHDRNHAALTAVRDGWTEEEIAHELGVLPQDVHRWITGQDIDLR